MDLFDPAPSLIWTNTPGKLSGPFRKKINTDFQGNGPPQRRTGRLALEGYQLPRRLTAPHLAVPLERLHYDWRKLWFNQYLEPLSWVIDDQAVASGARKILFQSSLRPEGSNLVRYLDTSPTRTP